MFPLSVLLDAARLHHQLVTAYVQALEQITKEQKRTHVLCLPAEGLFGDPEKVLAWAGGMFVTLCCHQWFYAPGKSSPFTVVSAREMFTFPNN